jgi:MoaA/NifB/PqqE/SkfB family radical SAM enzyme
MGLILEEALSTCGMVSITTNGFSPSKILEDIQGALDSSSYGHLALNVSMNGSRSVHDEISGVSGSFENAKLTLEALRSLNNSRLSAGVSYTSSAFNKWEFNTYLREMADIGIGLEDITFGMGQDSPSYYQGRKIASIVSPGLDYIQDFSKNILKDLGAGTDPLKWVSKKYLEGFTKGYQNGHSPKCVAGQYSLMLDPYWNVYPCMFYCPSKPCGNLRDVAFQIDKLDLRGCQSIVKTCAGCWTPCESYSTIIFRPWRCL